MENGIWESILFKTMYLYILTENFTNGFWDNILNIIAVMSILASILVIISKNPIVSVLFLIGLFLGLSCYLLMLGLNFIGLSYLLVYVGAVSILFLFILMLINVRVSELLSYTSNSIPLAIMIGIIFNYAIYPTLPQDVTWFKFINNLWKYVEENVFSYKNINDELTYVTSKQWDGSLLETSHISSIGNIMYTSYSIWLIITSIILLLAMVGTIVITVKQNLLKKYQINR